MSWVSYWPIHSGNWVYSLRRHRLDSFFALSTLSDALYLTVPDAKVKKSKKRSLFSPLQACHISALSILLAFYSLFPPPICRKMYSDVYRVCTLSLELDLCYILHHTVSYCNSCPLPLHPLVIYLILLSVMVLCWASDIPPPPPPSSPLL